MEIGRAGRDGEVSQCTLLASPQDRIALENFTFGDTPTPDALRSLIEEVLRQGEEFDVSVYDLSQRHDIRNLVVETVLTYLELDGVLRSTKPFYAEYRISWVRAQADALRKYYRSLTGVSLQNAGLWRFCSQVDPPGRASGLADFAPAP